MNKEIYVGHMHDRGYVNMPYTLSEGNPVSVNMAPGITNGGSNIVFKSSFMTSYRRPSFKLILSTLINRDGTTNELTHRLLIDYLSKEMVNIHEKYCNK